MDDDKNDSVQENLPPKIERITRTASLEHPLLAPRLDAIYEKALLQNPTIPATLEKFVNGTLDGELASNVVAKGRVKWQKK